MSQKCFGASAVLTVMQVLFPALICFLIHCSLLLSYPHTRTPFLYDTSHMLQFLMPNSVYCDAMVSGQIQSLLTMLYCLKLFV